MIHHENLYPFNFSLDDYLILNNSAILISERSDALNFKMALQDYEKSIEKDLILKKISTDLNDGKDDATLKPVVHKLSLEEGEMIHVKIKGLNFSGQGKAKKRTTHCSLRKPPPPASSEASSVLTSEDDEEWSDFK